MKRKFIILMGKSASGKSTIASELVTRFGFKKYRTITTRPKRDGESNLDYIFVDDKKFWKWEMKGKFIENMAYHTEVGGISATWNYATPKIRKWSFSIMPETYVVVLTPCGARKFVDYYGVENCKVVYLDTDETVRTIRAKKRGSFDETEWNRRLITDSRDFSSKALAKCFKENEYIKIKNNKNDLGFAMVMIEKARCEFDE